MSFKIIIFFCLLATILKADDFCPDSTIKVDGVCLTVNEISKTGGNAGHISSAFYGLGSGFNSVYGLFYSINDLTSDESNAKHIVRMLPSSLTFITAGTVNQVVKLKRKKVFEKLGGGKMKCRPLLLVGVSLFATSITTDLLYNVSQISDNRDFKFAAMIINSSTITSSFIVNVIGKVVQAKELDYTAEKVLENSKVSVEPYLFYSLEKSGAGISLKF